MKVYTLIAEEGQQVPIGTYTERTQAHKIAKEFAKSRDVTVTLYGQVLDEGASRSYYFEQCLFFAPKVRNRIAQGMKILKKYFPLSQIDREEYFPGLLNGNPMSYRWVVGMSARDYVAMQRHGWLSEPGILKIPLK